MGATAFDRPVLLPCEAEPVQLEDGSDAILLKDPQGVAPGMAVISPAAYFVLAHCDGQRTVDDVVRVLTLQGHRVEAAAVLALVDQLSEAGFMRGPRRDELVQEALEAYRGAPHRAAACAGGAYPGEREALVPYLDAFFTHPKGPGPLGAPCAAGRDARLLVAPHIDPHRGGTCYAHAYKALWERCDADLFVVFGTAHASPQRLFSLTRQDYDTPLGKVPTDVGVVDAVARALGDDEVFGDELVHRGEHSCEFQVLWLQYLYGLAPRTGRPIQVLPVLCSTISHLEDPAAATAPFLDALARAVEGRRVCYVAGADLAHVGPRYGDPRPPTEDELARFAAQDRSTLSFLARGDLAGFHRDAIVDDELRRLCGVAPIYAAMRLAGRGAALLDYGQWADGVDSVSYAACVG